jgi:hypothetical protein
MPSPNPTPPNPTSAPLTGITTIDTADIYGPSEALVGRFLRLYPERAASAQVLTKISFFGEDLRHVSADLVRYKVRSSLARLGVQRASLVQLYWDDFKVKGWADAALYLAELQAQGLVQHVGLTNFDVPHMLQVGVSGSAAACAGLCRGVVVLVCRCCAGFFCVGGQHSDVCCRHRRAVSAQQHVQQHTSTAASWHDVTAMYPYHTCPTHECNSHLARPHNGRAPGLPHRSSTPASRWPATRCSTLS